MEANSKAPQSPDGPAPDEAAQPAPGAAPEGPSDRIWKDPIGIGETVPIDPELYKPPLSKEELEKLLGEE